MTKRCFRYIIKYKEACLFGRNVKYDFEIESIEGYDEINDYYTSHSWDVREFQPLDLTKRKMSWSETYGTYEDAVKEAMRVVDYYSNMIEKDYELFHNLNAEYVKKTQV